MTGNEVVLFVMIALIVLAWALLIGTTLGGDQ
jgi:hypothetical protein